MSLCIVLVVSAGISQSVEHSPSGIEDKEIDLAADGFLVANNQP
jgi:hypothetical protein